jgi:hypothetical protein
VAAATGADADVLAGDGAADGDEPQAARLAPDTAITAVTMAFVTTDLLIAPALRPSSARSPLVSDGNYRVKHG